MRCSKPSLLTGLLSAPLWLSLYAVVCMLAAVIMAVSVVRNGIERLWLSISKGPLSKPPRSPGKMRRSPPTPWQPSGRSKSDTGQ